MHIPPGIVLVGGGHSLRIFKNVGHEKSETPIDIILISPSSFYTLHRYASGLISGNYKEKDAYVDLVKLCNASGVRLLIGSVDKINLYKSQ